ncbi:hypothetical protein [Actinomyces sp.]|uniref:hypothetical protein n=1 Tax=Actinomyces sp. TaxID=29317 RepID=UPI00289F692A|nr:hypothetical protein [Actinomyces sp.]
MFRILLVVAWLAVTIYAIADWARTPEEEMPGRIPRIMWLIIILLTIPSFSIGSVVWLVVRAVGRAETADGTTGSTTPRPMFPRPSRPSAPAAPPGPLAPDDDPEFLFRLERDIRRRRAAEGDRSPKDEGGAGDGPGPLAGGTTPDGDDHGDGPDEPDEPDGPTGGDTDQDEDDEPGNGTPTGN